MAGHKISILECGASNALQHSLSTDGSKPLESFGVHLPDVNSANGRMTFRDGTPKLPEGMGGIYEDFDAFDAQETHSLNDRRDSLRYFAGER